MATLTARRWGAWWPGTLDQPVVETILVHTAAGTQAFDPESVDLPFDRS